MGNNAQKAKLVELMAKAVYELKPYPVGIARYNSVNDCVSPMMPWEDIKGLDRGFRLKQAEAAYDALLSAGALVQGVGDCAEPVKQVSAGEPLPCPFCGEAGQLMRRSDVLDDATLLYWVACYNDSCATKTCRTQIFMTSAEAVAAWNTRASDPPKQPDSAGENEGQASIERLLAGIDVGEVAEDMHADEYYGTLDERDGHVKEAYLHQAKAAIASIKRQLDKQGVK